MVLKAIVTAQPAGYLGAGGVSWSSSNPSVASVSSSAADSVVLTLTGEGETVLTARADGVRGTFSLRVLAAPVSATLNLSPAMVTLNGTEGGNAPEAQTVRVTVTGDEAPTLGTVQYGPGAEGWLIPALGASAGGEAVLTVRADVGGLVEGSYAATLPVTAGSLSRSVEVRLTLAPNPANAPVEATDAAAREITALLAEYSDAINTRNVNRVREIFPTLPQDAVDDLLGLRDTDTYYLQLAPGSLRLGAREETLEGDVLSGVLGRDNQGQLVRMIYTFGRGQRGWYIVSLRAGG